MRTVDPKTGAGAAPAVVVKQRADARRNRKRVLDAARAQFAEHGVEAQIDDIARAAGLGVGTVYRHFPTKDALLEALAADRFQRLAEWADEALAEPDPWEAFCHFLRRSAELQASDRALSKLMSERESFQGAANEAARLLEATQAVVDRTQASGELRPEITAEDVAMLMCGLGSSCGPHGFAGKHGMGWERYLDILIAGLRMPDRN
ncbi:MAG TPA: TetR/AcrR family transcriptional regulator [Solirubrobacterales bacterium]|jgi:AcrR family transcriptional regulator|nr:TetR/AcrR family transcriptional regulator [Solirubrobacterales bacterium]